MVRRLRSLLGRRITVQLVPGATGVILATEQPLTPADMRMLRSILFDRTYRGEFTITVPRW